MFIISKPTNVYPELLTKENLPNTDLVEYMRSTQLGVGFVNRHMGLPQNTFVSNDAVTWLINNTNINSRNKAVERLQVVAKSNILKYKF